MAKRKYRIINSADSLYYIQELVWFLWFKRWETLMVGESYETERPVSFNSLSEAKTALYDYATKPPAKVVYEIEYDN